jgi:hypothetical protein
MTNISRPGARTADWRKSSYSNGSGGECVEVAAGTRGAYVRDSKNPGGPVLAFPAEAWGAFVAEIRRGGPHLER